MAKRKAGKVVNVPLPKPKPKKGIKKPVAKPAAENKKKGLVVKISAKTLVTPSRYKRKNGKQQKISYNERFKEIKKEKALANLKKLVRGS